MISVNYTSENVDDGRGYAQGIYVGDSEGTSIA